MQIFFVGWHQPVKGKSGCRHLDYCMISANRLINRRASFPVRNWAMDSGAFTRITSGKGHLDTQFYAALIDRFVDNGNLMFVVSQDYMCEPFVLNITGLTIADHQRMTIERYDELLSYSPKPYIMPVLQGYAPSDYVNHIKDYGDRLREGAWVGVGSVCKRNSSPGQILSVLLAIKGERPDLRLHGFGVKKNSLLHSPIWDLLYSADSAAAGLVKGRGSIKYVGSNDPQTALDYANSIKPPAQLSIWSYS
jgi:hypothetical protein